MVWDVGCGGLGVAWLIVCFGFCVSLLVCYWCFVVGGLFLVVVFVWVELLFCFGVLCFLR